MSSGWKKFWTFLLGALFVIAFVAFVAGLVVRRDLLDPALYTSALADTDVYERLYVDVFGDPALQESLAETLGIESNLLAGETYAELIAVFNMVLPPPRLQSATESFFLQVTNYLAGRSPELEPTLPLDEMVNADALAGRITNALVAGAIQVAAKAAPLATQAAGPLIKEELVAYLDEVSAGKVGPVPATLVGMSVDALTPDEQNDLVNELLGPVADKTTSIVKHQMRAALAENDLVGALAIAMRERLRERVQAGAAKLETRIADSGALNAVEQTATAVNSNAETVIAALNVVRGYANTVQTLLLPLAIILALLLGAIVWINGDDLKTMLRAAGWTLAVAGGLVLLAWLGVGFWLRGTLQDTLGATTGLPTGLEAIVDDVVGALTRNIWDALWGTALIFFILGLVLLAFGYSAGLLAILGRVLAPIWEYKGWVLGGLLAIFVLAPLLVWLFSPTARAERLACNGHVELCDRPANEVAYATTHNSMSISDYGWLWPSHDGTISDQLNAGIRALLIDTHYADTLEQIDTALGELSPAAQEVAREVIAAGDFRTNEGSFLCHMACGLGARVFIDTLAEIRTFLEENPRDVLFIVIQDAITPEDTVREFEEAGLVQYIYDHPGGQAWPTLGEMIDSGQRLVVMAEEEGPPPTWYQNVWENTMETPYTFVNYDDFSCASNRGASDAPFFLLNHWIQRGAPNRVDASIVNDYDFLLARAQQCAQERGKMPNFVAVNFYQNGDVIGVVEMLNGFGN